MSLIHCPDCSTPISDRAPACLQCGRPLGGTAHTQTIEASSKVWKGIQLIGMIAMFLGFCSCAGSCDHNTAEAARQEFARNGVNTFLVGLVGFTIGKGGRWWFHA